MSWPTPRLAVLVLTAAVSLPMCAASANETGSFIFQQYTSKVWGASPQNWAIAQDSRGVMYFGNTDGVLEFDGLYWRTIPLTNNSPVRALGVDSHGVIYVGGQGVFGYLAGDKRGATKFVPLKVPEGDAKFGDIWNVVPTPAGVYFGAYSAIFHLTNSGEIKVIRPHERFGNIFVAYNELFVTTSDAGLKRLEGDELIAGPRSAKDSFRGQVLFAPGDQPLLAAGSSLQRFGLTEISLFANQASDYFAEHGIYSLAQLPGGEVAVGTSGGGLVLLGQDGDLRRIFRKQDGVLPSDRVTAIFLDQQQGLWLATDNGIVRYSSTLSSFGERHGLRGQVISEGRLAGTIYAGTTRGLFRMDTAAGTEPAFHEVGDLHEAIWALQEHDGESFAAGDHALYRVNGDKVEQLAPTKAIYDLGFSRRDKDTLYTAGSDGLRVWRHAGKDWVNIITVPPKNQELRTVVEAQDGRVWATSRSFIWRFDVSFNPVKIEQFDAPAGGPGDWTNAYWFRGHVVFATAKGLMRFSEQESRLVPDTELGVQYADGSKSVQLLREDEYGRVWITGGAYHAVLQKDQTGEYQPLGFPLLQSGIAEMWSVFIDKDGTCWASGEKGELVRFQRNAISARRPPPPVLLRRVTVIGHTEPVYQGDAEEAGPLELQYRDNALRFEFAEPFLDDPSSVRYQFRLEDNEKQWSAWGTEPRKDYTNLFEGSYVFHVRARDGHGRETPEVAYAFKVAPPFYRRWWAYLFYAVVFLLAGWAILRWRLKALQEQNRRLEVVVQERTAEVRAERDQNEALLLNILPEPVAAELRANNEVKPTNFDDVTVCFSDFVGFTLSSENMAADLLINSLNKYFTQFDKIIGRYELEKLKTIGDSYMFAGGLPKVRPSHAVDSVLAALEMAAAVVRLTKPELGVDWKIRLGLNSGPVVAGVVGVRKFAFDIWGSTVNFAARMESAGAPGRVNLSETTYERVKAFIECETRGAVPIKEGRRVEMYFAIGPKPELMTGPVVDGVPAAFREAYEKAFGEPLRSFPSAAVLQELQKQPVMTTGGEIK